MFAKFIKFLRDNGLDVVILGLLEKLFKRLVDRLDKLLSGIESTKERLIQKRTAKLEKKRQ
jgi:hypothetical protein